METETQFLDCGNHSAQSEDSGSVNEPDVDEENEDKGALRYTTKRRGGLRLKDIKTTERNGDEETEPQS